MPDYSTYSDTKLIHLLENKADYKAEAVEEAMVEWNTREMKPKAAKKIAEEIVRAKIRRILSGKSRLFFRPQQMELPESHFLSPKAVSRIFGVEFKNWKERKKLFDNNPNADPSLF